MGAFLLYQHHSISMMTAQINLLFQLKAVRLKVTLMKEQGI
jgi:hypothetical protein